MKPYWIRVTLAKGAVILAKRGSRNQTWSDRMIRRLLGRVLRFNFDLDEMVLADQGYDPDELERYQCGELSDTRSIVVGGSTGVAKPSASRVA